MQSNTINVISHPTISTDNHQIYFENQSMDISNQGPLVWKLLQIFACHPSPITKDDLIENLYETSINDISIRRKTCMYNSLNKLIARVRTECQKHFDNTNSPRWQWFVYSRTDKSYTAVMPLKQAQKQKMA